MSIEYSCYCSSSLYEAVWVVTALVCFGYSFFSLLAAAAAAASCRRRDSAIMTEKSTENDQKKTQNFSRHASREWPSSVSLIVSPRKRKMTTRAMHDSVPSACKMSRSVQAPTFFKLLGRLCLSSERRPLGHIRARVSCTCRQTWFQTCHSQRKKEIQAWKYQPPISNHPPQQNV